MEDDHDATFTLTRLPQFASLEFDTLEDRLETLLAQHRARIGGITADPQIAGWQQVAEPMETMADELHRFFSPVSHLHNVADEDAIREPYKACIALISEYGSELAQNKSLFQAYEQLHSSTEFNQYNNAQKKVIANALRDFRLGGVDLPDPEQKRIKALKVELAELQTRFEENVLDATQAFKLQVDDEDKLDGLPASVIALARQNASREDTTGWILTLDFPCYMPAMMRLNDRELRRTLYEAYCTRASDQGPNAATLDNSEVMTAILEKRQALAHTLGFANYAELSLATKMAPSTTAVIDFLDDLAQKARPAAERELHELKEFSAAHLNITDIKAWDIGYCAEKLKQHRYGLSQEDLKPYFPEAQVVSGMFEVAGQLFNIAIDEIDDVDTWHPDVRFFAVREVGGGILGYFYLDLYSRERKRPGAWMDECLIRWRHHSNAQLPVAYLTCNFTPPVTAEPTLLTHDEVSTLFHEFGHGLHHMLTTVDRPAVAGINGVPWDAVELPSQLLENWCWERGALDIISAHHETGAALPDELYERLIETKRFQAAMQMVRQLEFALFDFLVHIEFDTDTDIQALLDDIRHRVAVVTPPAYNRFQHSFSHIFAGGYAAGYYSYKWAEVLSADAFSLFEEEGVFDRETGLKFRSIVLENGGAEDAMTLFERFRGRAPSVEPLLRQAGLNA